MSTASSEFRASVRRHVHHLERPATDTIWAPELECASRERLAAIQSEKLAAAYRYLFDDSPYHRQKFQAAGLGRESVRGIEDLSRIPVTRKLEWLPDFSAHPPWGTFSPLRPERWAEAGWMVFSTSGTTHLPRLFRHTLHDREMWSWMCARALWAYGVRPGQTALNCFFYGPSVAAWGMHEGLLRLGCSVVPGGPMNSDRRALFINTMKPEVLLGTPSSLLTIAHRMREVGQNPATAGVKVLVCAGEPGAAVPATRRRLAELWNAAVHDDFGCTEVAMAPLGFTCSHAQRPDGNVSVHLMEDALVIEVLDPETLQPVPDGERGTLVVSNLYSEACPILRFDMGDWIVLDRSPCACGRTSARAIGGLLGRNDHCLKIKGLQFFPSTFEEALRQLPGVGDEYRIEVREGFREGRPIPANLPPASNDDRRWHRDEVHLVVEGLPGARVDADELVRRLRGLLGITVGVQVVPAGTIPRTDGKGARFVDLRNRI